MIGKFKCYAAVVKTYPVKNLATGHISVIHATTNHPFYLKNKQVFVPIGKVSGNDELVNERGERVKTDIEKVYRVDTRTYYELKEADGFMRREPNNFIEGYYIDQVIPYCISKPYFYEINTRGLRVISFESMSIDEIGKIGRPFDTSYTQEVQVIDHIPISRIKEIHRP